MSTVATELNELKTSSNRKWLVGLIAVALLAYWNSFPGVFLWDDLNNGWKKTPHFESPFYYLSAIFFPLERRILRLTFTLNCWLGDQNPWGYHAVNLLIHSLSGLALFGIVRRTLKSERISPEFANAAGPLSFAIASIFLAHPLQTESVTLIVQRAQSLMGMLALVGFYGFIRGCEAPRPWRWFTFSIVCLAIGLTTKPHIVAIPAILGLYDIIFISGSIRESIRLRKGYYIVLTLAWILILANVGRSLETSDVGTMSLDSDKMTFREYALSQFGVISYYIYLMFVPVNLCLDYSWPVAIGWMQIIPPAIFILSLLALTIWAFFRFPAWSFIGAWFFLQLSPISLIPRPDLAVEHRLYLPLAAFSALIVLSVFYLAGKLRKSTWNFGDTRDWRQRAFIVSAVGILTLCVLTMTRNMDYHSEYKMCLDCVVKTPNNARAHNNIANEYLKNQKLDEALPHILKAIQLKPALIPPRRLLAGYFWAKGQYGEMIKVLKTLENWWGKEAEYHCYLSAAYRELGNSELAQAELQKALEIDPGFPLALNLRKQAAAGGR